MVLTIGVWSDFGKLDAVLSTSFHFVESQFQHCAMATIGLKTSPRQDLLDGLARIFASRVFGSNAVPSWFPQVREM
jgi:hypothetical protein